MAKRVIRGELSSQGIQSIIDQLRDYEQGLHRKAELLCQRLAEAGLTVSQAKIGESPLGKTIHYGLIWNLQKQAVKPCFLLPGRPNQMSMAL